MTPFKPALAILAASVSCTAHGQSQDTKSGPSIGPLKASHWRSALPALLLVWGVVGYEKNSAIGVQRTHWSVIVFVGVLRTIVR